MKFYGELGYGLETKLLHFGDDPHHYPDPGVRNRSLSGSKLHSLFALQKSFSNSIMLVFGGGLRSLSTSSFLCCLISYDIAKMLKCLNVDSVDMPPPLPLPWLFEDGGASL